MIATLGKLGGIGAFMSIFPSNPAGGLFDFQSGPVTNL